MEEEHVISCTGKTKNEWSEELKVIEAGKKKVPKRCYLCRRAEGDIAINVKVNTEDEDDAIMMREIHLKKIARTFRKSGFTFEFEVCSDCVILLNEFKGEDTDFDMSDFLKSRPRF